MMWSIVDFTFFSLICSLGHRGLGAGGVGGGAFGAGGLGTGRGQGAGGQGPGTGYGPGGQWCSFETISGHLLYI